MFICICFFFSDTATTEIYTLSLHDALPISSYRRRTSRPGAASSSKRSAAGDRSRETRSSCRATCGQGSGRCSRRGRSEEHTSELQSQSNLVCRLLLEKKKYKIRVSTQPSRN